MTQLRFGVGRKGGGVAETATELRPAPWVAAGKATAVGTNACAWKRRPVARRALADQEDGAPFSATACVKHPTTPRPWRRGRQERNLEARRKKRLACAHAGVHAGARASCPHGHC
jgi:hypothetical protein